MKKTVTVIVSVLLVAAMMFTFAGCGAKGKVRASIKEFQTACNELNIEGVIDCLDPTVSGALKLGAGLLGSLTGTDAEGVFEKLSALLVTGAESFGIDSFKTLKIKVKDIAANDTTADAKVEFTYTAGSGEEKTSDGTISLKSTDEGWKITGVKFR
ncbi:MAG: hypothetical protein IJL25_08045 [Clostridia bacterium]|nr:hypothetical protein [Clostridia bacterium]